MFGSLISDVTCNYVSADRRRDGLPFPGTGCPIPDVDYLCLLCIDFYVWDAVSIFNHLPRMFLSTDFAFWITDWTSCHGPHLHAILRIISRLSNWFSLRRLGPWMNHLPPAWESTFRLTFQNKSWYVSLEWYFIYLLFLASVHDFTYKTRDFFYSVITFSYTKWFVHSYTVDVVFTLSYEFISEIHGFAFLFDEKIFESSVKHKKNNFWDTFVRPFIYINKCRGPRIYPCGTLQDNPLHDDLHELYLTYCFLLER